MDPIYALATPFRASESKSASKKLLMQPPSYDRIVVESRWRHCSRNRMRIKRRMPVSSNSLGSRATVDDYSCLENGIVSSKKSRLDSFASESFNDNMVSANCDSDKLSDGSPGSESGNSELTGRACPDNNDVQSIGSFSSNSGAFESNSVSAGQPQCHDSSVQVVTVNTSQATGEGFKVDDCWWNKVDSRTWLQGVQTYLLLHSSAGVKTHRMPVAVLPPNATPFTLIGSPVSSQQATTSVIMESPTARADGLQSERQIARPGFAPIAGYRVLTNGVLSAVPIYYLPVVNYSVCGLTSGASAIGSQETYLGGRRSSMAAVDLVSFMHNYCLPPASTLLSPVSPTFRQTGHDVAGQDLGPLSNEGAGSLLTSAVTACEYRSVPAVPQQREDGHSSSWLMMSKSSHSEGVGNLARSGVCLTPRSLSSVSSAECWADDASGAISASSTVVNYSHESEKSVEIKTNSLFSEDTDLTIPGWFGKGLSIRRPKRRISRQS